MCSESAALARLTILADNRAAPGLVEEHGFAVGIELPGRRLLFDTGKGEALLPNAASLGWPLSGTDALVLSHGHHDHVGAVPAVLEQNPACRVYCHPGAFRTRYSVKTGAAPREIGILADLAARLKALPTGQLQPVRDSLLLQPAVGLTGAIPRRHPLEDTGGPFFLDPHGLAADPLDDDLALWLVTPQGLVIVTGCCHAGLINTVEHIRSLSGEARIHAILGGLHLLNADAQRLAATCAALRTWQPEQIIPCHCTGSDAVAVLKTTLGERVVDGRAGLRLEFPLAAP